MAISDLFRSKFRHSDPEVRAAAVRSLSSDDTEALVTVVREDDDPGVRALAYERLADADALIELAAAESHESTRQIAERRADELLIGRALEAGPDEARAIIAKLAGLRGQHGLAQLTIRGQNPALCDLALDAITDARAVAAVARSHDASQQIRLVAIDRVTDVDVLRAIAIDDQIKEVALAAVDRIASDEVLEQVANKAKLKPVRARARKTVTDAQGGVEGVVEPDDQDAAAKRLAAERAQLLRNVEAIAERHEWVGSLAELEAAEAAWNSLGADPDPEREQRFRVACETYRSRRDKYATAEEKAATEKPVAPEPPQVIEMVAVDPPAVAESEVEAAPVAAEDEAAPAAEAAEAAPPAPVLSAEEAATKKEENKAILERLVGELETIENIKKLKTAEKKLSKTQAGFEALHPMPSGPEAHALIDRYHAAHKALFIKVQEMKEADEWQRWANVPKRERLVESAKELLGVDNDGKLANKLKELQAAWKEVGPVPQKRGQELWEEFKGVCDQVYERVKVHRSEQNEVRKANLELKRQLCEQVEAIKDSDDWQGTANDIKRLQNEWKKIGPVPRKQADLIWKRFRAACDHFFERRRPHLEQVVGEQTDNLAAKERLITRAEELAQSEDWRDAAQELKDLQRRWKKIGFVPRKEAQSVNKRFRAACDLFFQRRDEHYKALDAAKEQKLVELGEQMAALSGDGEGDAAERVQKTLDMRKSVLSAEGPNGKLAELRKQLRELQAVVVAACPDQVKGTELDPSVNERRMAKLVARAEELAPSEKEVAAPTTAAEMAERLRQAFNKNALGGFDSKTGGRPMKDVVGELRESWSRLGPVPGPTGSELEKRFERACQRSLAAARD